MIIQPNKSIYNVSSCPTYVSANKIPSYIFLQVFGTGKLLVIARLKASSNLMIMSGRVTAVINGGIDDRV